MEERSKRGEQNSQRSVVERRKRGKQAQLGESETKVKGGHKNEVIPNGIATLTPVEVPPDIQLLVAHVSTKGSCVKVAANPSREEGGVAMRPTMGLYVERDQCAHLVALGKVFEGASTIHSVPYGDDVVKVSVTKVYDGNAEVPFPTSKIQYVRQTLDSFVAWPTHHVQLVSHEVFVVG